jgi:hypothetical protein
VVGEILLQIDPAQRDGNLVECGEQVLCALGLGQSVIQVALGFTQQEGKVVERDRLSGCSLRVAS